VAKRKFQIIGPLMGENSWVSNHPEIFSSEQSFRWWLRQHRKRLVDQSALVRLRDQWFVTSLLNDAVAQIATEAAKSKLQQAA
jgi:hypothetical protein